MTIELTPDFEFLRNLKKDSCEFTVLGAADI